LLFFRGQCESQNVPLPSIVSVDHDHSGFGPAFRFGGVSAAAVLSAVLHVPPPSVEMSLPIPCQFMSKPVVQRNRR
jgi:hypothetical protein